MDFQNPLKDKQLLPYWFDRSLKSPLMSLKIRLWFYVFRI
jgi:hypothetical protein